MKSELPNDIVYGKLSMGIGPFRVDFTFPRIWYSKVVDTWPTWIVQESDNCSSFIHSAEVSIFAEKDPNKRSDTVQLLSMKDADSSWIWPTDPAYLETTSFTDAWGQESDFRRHIDYSIRNVLVHAGLQNYGLLMHAATVVVDGKAYVAPGKSGRGKTTLFRLLGGYDAEHLHEDLAFIMNNRAYSLPCRSSHTHWNIPKPGSARLGGFIELGRAKEVSGREVRSEAQKLQVVSSALVPPILSSNIHHDRLLNITERISRANRCLKVSFPNDPSVRERLERTIANL